MKDWLFSAVLFVGIGVGSTGTFIGMGLMAGGLLR